jgi:hypothetical protein
MIFSTLRAHHARRRRSLDALPPPLFGQRLWKRRFDNSEGYEDGRLDREAGLDSIASGQLHTYLRLLGVEGKVLAPIFHHVCFLKVGIA